MRMTNRIKETRIKQGLKQGELAARAGMPQGTVSFYERGLVEHPTLTGARKLAKALGVSVDELFCEEA